MKKKKSLIAKEERYKCAVTHDILNNSTPVAVRVVLEKMPLTFSTGTGVPVGVDILLQTIDNFFLSQEDVCQNYPR